MQIVSDRELRIELQQQLSQVKPIRPRSKLLQNLEATVQQVIGGIYQNSEIRKLLPDGSPASNIHEFEGAGNRLGPAKRITDTRSC